MGFWNVRGWNKNPDTDNYKLRAKCVNHLNLDILCVAESHLCGDDKLILPGYTWFGQNRDYIHPRAKCGSGGIGVFIHNNALYNYDVCVLDNNVQGALWLMFKAMNNNYCDSFKLCVCYLPPERSSRAVNAQTFYEDLLQQVYTHQDELPIVICGDFNSRIGCKPDFIEGVDNIPERKPMDTKCNAHGNCLLEFLLSTNFCVVNGRSVQDDFTCVSGQGMSVVDYCIIPHEHFNKVKNFAVSLTRSVIEQAGGIGELDISRGVPDHSILTWTFANNICVPPSQVHQGGATQSRLKFNLNSVDATFMSDAQGRAMLDCINDKIEQIELVTDIETVYDTLCKELKNYMKLNIDNKTIYPNTSYSQNKRNKATKPWWTNELSATWKQLAQAEKNFVKAPHNEKPAKKAVYKETRRRFDRLVQRAKRQYWYQQQQDILNKHSTDQKDFWRFIGTVGVAEERVPPIPMEVILEDGSVCSDTNTVMNMWQEAFKDLLNKDNTSLDSTHNHVLEPPQNATMSASHLNDNITRDEIVCAIKLAKQGKATGVDELPVEIFKNDNIVNTLCLLFNKCFGLGFIPSSWRKGIIHPVPKGSDSRNPLNYRGITLASCVYKLYCSVLNRRIVKWVEDNNILCDEQIGFRKDRNCLDHISSVYLICDTRLKLKQNTFVAFIDFSKAYDHINRDLLWRKLYEYGIHGTFYNALLSLYNNVESCVRINGLYTDYFNIQSGVKQGCLLSPVLFNLYINDLCQEMKTLNKGVTINNEVVNILLYADDAVLIAESESDLQIMINALSKWCSKWEMKLNVEKSKVMHVRHPEYDISTIPIVYENIKLDYVSKYKYLGLVLNEHMDMNESVKNVALAANRALGILIAKTKKCGGFPFQSYSKLYDSLVQPIIDYSAGIWGVASFSCINAVQYRAARFFLGVGNFTPNAAVAGDVAWKPSEQRQWGCVGKLWGRLNNLPEDRLANKVFQWAHGHASSGIRNWIYKCVHYFRKHDLVYMSNILNYDVNHSLQRFDEYVYALYIDKWKAELARETAKRGTGGNKLRTYKLFKEEFETEAYVTQIMPPRHRRALAQFRAGVAPIRIETGRYERGRIPVHERVCYNCPGIIEDEKHVILECPMYNNLRTELLNNCNNVCNDFNVFDNNKKLGFILSHPQIVRKTAKTLFNILEKRKTYFYAN